MLFRSFSGDDVLAALGPGIDASAVQRLSAWTLYYGSNNLTFARYAPAYTGYTFSWTPTTGVWYFVAVSRSGTSLRAFINGSQIGTTQTASTDFSNINTTDGFQIGKMIAGGGTSYYLNGYIDDLRITKGYARYTGSFTAPSTPFQLF